MLSLAALFFSVSAVAWMGGGAAKRWAAVVPWLACLGCCVAGHGVASGLLVLSVMAMLAASVLVLLLAPRPTRARAVAWASGGVGLLPLLLAGVGR
jgi:choline-glycine betaine transporter